MAQVPPKPRKDASAVSSGLADLVRLLAREAAREWAERGFEHLSTNTPLRQAEMTRENEYLRARDIARLTGVSLRTARRWIAKQILVSGKIGGARLVAKNELERLLPPPFNPPDCETADEHD